MSVVKDLVADRKILIAAHRGANGGNIPCNSIEGYLIAVNHGADLIELDVTVSKDRKLYLLHPGMEWLHLGKKIDLSKMDSSEIDGLMLCNQDCCETLYPLYKFEDALEALKGKALINVDKFWSDPEMISKAIRKHNMADQCIVKSFFPDKKTIEQLKTYAYDMQYMALIREKSHIIPELYDKDINFVGVEILFDSDKNEVASEEFIDELHKKGLIAWGNSIVYNYRDVIAGDHTDDKALLGDPEHGWGWFAKKGFDILQTDWVLPCAQYLKSKNYKK